MAIDRFITWKKNERPTIEQLTVIARDFLGHGWNVSTEAAARDGEVCWISCVSNQINSYPLASESETQRRLQEQTADERGRRGFQVFHSKGSRTSVITRHCDEFTGCLADGLTKIYARWWGAKIEWPT